MSNDLVLPNPIRLGARTGQSTHQDFVVMKPLPDGALTATIVGDSSIFRLREFVAYDRIYEDSTGMLPGEEPPTWDDDNQPVAVQTIETARVGAGTPLPVRAGQFVDGIIDCVAPPASPPAHYTATLNIDGWLSGRVEVPILFIAGEIQVEFLVNPPVAHRQQWTDLPVRVTLSGAPALDITLEAQGGVEIPPQSIHVPQGGSGTATLKITARPNTPLGPYATELIVNGYSNTVERVPFTVEIKEPVRPVQLDPAITIQRIHSHYLSLGGPAGVLGYPTSPVKFITTKTAIREYRGGYVQATAKDGPIGVVTQALQKASVSVRFVGFRCIKESDHDQLSPTDEPYFLITASVAGGIPLVKPYGPYPNTETNTEVGVGDPVVEDLWPNPMSILVVAYEEDRGDAAETAANLQAYMVEAAKEIQQIAAAHAADAADGPGIGPQAAAGVAGALAGPLGSAIAVGIVTALILGDDYIGQDAIVLFERQSDVKSPEVKGVFRDKRYTHKLNITNESEGKYELYFDVVLEAYDPPKTVT